MLAFQVLPAEMFLGAPVDIFQWLLMGNAQISDAQLEKLWQVVVPEGLVPKHLKDQAEVRDTAEWVFKIIKNGDENFRPPKERAFSPFLEAFWKLCEVFGQVETLRVLDGQWSTTTWWCGSDRAQAPLAGHGEPREATCGCGLRLGGAGPRWMESLRPTDVWQPEQHV